MPVSIVRNWGGTFLDHGGDVYNVRHPAFGAVGDGIADDTTAIQAASTAAGANSIVFFPGSDSYYSVSGLITVAHANQTWEFAPGAEIRWATLGATTLGSFGAGTAGVRVNADNFAIDGGVLRGPTSGGTYVSNEAILCMVGTSTSVRRSGLTISGTEMLYSGSYGVFAQFVNDIRVDDGCYVHNVGHMGLGFLSCDRGRVYDSRIQTVTPGTGGDAYAIALTHYSVGYSSDPNAGTKAATHPFCADWIVQGSLIEDSVNTGLDAHGGYEISFLFNRIFACKRAIQLGGSSGDASGYAGANNWAVGNICDANTGVGGVSGRENTGVGIETSTGGAGTVKHDNVQVLANTVRNHGVVSSATGAIMGGAKNSRYAGNTVTRWGGVAISANADDNAVEDNFIGRLANAGDTWGYAIYSASTTGNLKVAGNKVRAEGGTAAVNGFRATSLLTRPTIAGNDFAAATSLPVALSADGFNRGPDFPNIINATDAATTVDVSVLTLGVPGEVRFAYTNPATVTNLTNGWQGQVVTLCQTNAVAITFNRDNALLAGGANWVGTQYDTLTLKKVGAYWNEISRSANS